MLFIYLLSYGSIVSQEYDVSPRTTCDWYHDIAYRSSNIDLFIYGLDKEAAKQKMLEIYEVICNAVPNEVACFRSLKEVEITEAAE